MKVKSIRTVLFAAAAFGVIGAAIPVPAQVFTPDGSKSPAAKGPTSAGEPDGADGKVCKDLEAKIKALPKLAKGTTQASICAASGQALGILQSMRVIIEVCNSGGSEMNASLLKMFDNFVNMGRDGTAKECQ